MCIFLSIYLSCTSALNFLFTCLFVCFLTLARRRYHRQPGGVSRATSTPAKLLLFLLFVYVMVRYTCSYFCIFYYCEGRRQDWYLSPEQATNCIGKLIYQSFGQHPELSTIVLCLSYILIHSPNLCYGGVRGWGEVDNFFLLFKMHFEAFYRVSQKKGGLRISTS